MCNRSECRSSTRWASGCVSDTPPFWTPHTTRLRCVRVSCRPGPLLLCNGGRTINTFTFGLLININTDGLLININTDGFLIKINTDLFLIKINTDGFLINTFPFGFLLTTFPIDFLTKINTEYIFCCILNIISPWSFNLQYFTMPENRHHTFKVWKLYKISIFSYYCLSYSFRIF